jgi:uncharacterized protein YegL
MAAAGKMAALNTAVREVLPQLSDTSANNPHAQVLVRAIRFATGASWHLEAPADPDAVRWRDLSAGGYTDLGAALDLLAGALRAPAMPDRALPPAVVLVSDGMPTDDYAAALERLLQLPWARRSVRMAVAIGHDAAYETLAEFIGTPDVEPVTAANPEQLVLALRWATMHAARASSLLPPPAPGPRLVQAMSADAGEEALW